MATKNKGQDQDMPEEIQVLEQAQSSEDRRGGDDKKRPQRVSKYTWERSLVTLEMPLVEIPLKSHRIAKPDFDANDKKIKEIEEQIKHTIDRKKKILEELILKSRESRESGQSKSQPLRELFKEKLEKKAQYQKDFDEARKAFQQQKDKVNELFEQQQKLRQKMKKVMDADDLQERLEEVEHSLNNDVLPQSEEKKLVKEKEDLLRSLPLALPIKELQLKINEINSQRQPTKVLHDEAFSKLQEVKDELSELAGGLDEIKAFNLQDKEKNDPVFGEIKAEYDKKIDDLKEEKRKVREQFREQKDKYENEQEDIRYHDWVKKIQDNLRRDKQREEREENRLKEIEEQEKKKIETLENPYQSQINDSEILIKYCQLILKQEARLNEPEETKEQEEVQQVREVNEADLKKEKLEILAPKKEIQKFGGNNKKKQPVKKHAVKQTEDPLKKFLNLPLDIINAFDTVKVATPTFSDEIPATLQLVQEKLAFFTQQGEQELQQTKENFFSGNQTQDDKVFDDSAKTSNEASSKKTQKVYQEKETDFPTL